MRQTPKSMRGFEDFTRTRLSKHFFMRDFLLSEISATHGIANIPDDPALTILAGKHLCQNLLDPLEDTFGRLYLRSGYRSRALNDYGNAHKLNCARTDHPEECHVWDRQSSGDGALELIVGATVVIPWFADQYGQGRDWRDMAWWVHDHLPYSEMWFFPKLCAFNLSWRAKPWRKIASYIAPKGTLLARGAAPALNLAARQDCYRDFPAFCGRAS
ncbi:MAG: hypothetical protein JKX69_03315 [Rhodobacteraceae bacterium]|nr:hypothetical protein [Paracoccaceae bacterium]